MRHRISLLRIAAATGVALVLLAAVSWVVAGRWVEPVATVTGVVHANLDMLRGKRVLRASVLHGGQREGSAADWLTKAGLPTSVVLYSCLSRSFCSAHSAAYNRAVRREIERRFGYDILATLYDASRGQSGVYVVIDHKTH